MQKTLFAGLATGLFLFSIYTCTASATSVIVGTPTSSNCAPFQCTGAGASGASTRYTQIYDSSWFNEPFTISSIEFFKTSPNANLMSFDYEITLSTTTSSSSSFSLVYDENTGSDAALFAQGSFTPSEGDFFSFQGIGFDFDPSIGNLLVDFTLTNRVGSDPTFPRSLQFSFDSGIQRIYGNYGDSGSTGCSDGSDCGLVTGFNYAATASVPEPASLLLIGSGITGLLGSRIRSKRKA